MIPFTCRIKRLAKEPFLHFLLLGAAFFGLNGWREKQRPAENANDRIEVTAGVIERLRLGFQRQFNVPPDEAELRGLISAHIREEVLCREALALGLDRDDTIVRRRLAQKMEFLTDDIISTREPDEATLQRFFVENTSRYVRPVQVSFRHVYFSTQRRGGGAEAAACEALAELRKGAGDEAIGDPFLHGFEFAEREPDEVAALFGSEFAALLAAQPPGEWSGPLVSSYGLHLVRVEARSESKPVTLDAARAKVLRDFNDERRRTANREIFERLKRRYHITVDEPAITRAANSPVSTVRVSQ